MLSKCPLQGFNPNCLTTCAETQAFMRVTSCSYSLSKARPVISSLRCSGPLESEPVTERFRYRISSHVTGTFYPFAVHRDCPRVRGVLAIRFLLSGESYVVCATAANSPRSHALSSRVYVRPPRMLSRLFSGLLPWEGPRSTNCMSTAASISSGARLSVTYVTVSYIGPDNFINRLPWCSRSFRDLLRGH